MDKPPELDRLLAPLTGAVRPVDPGAVMGPQSAPGATVAQARAVPNAAPANVADGADWQAELDRWRARFRARMLEAADRPTLQRRMALLCLRRPGSPADAADIKGKMLALIRELEGPAGHPEPDPLEAAYRAVPFEDSYLPFGDGSADLAPPPTPWELIDLTATQRAGIATFAEVLLEKGEAPDPEAAKVLAYRVLKPRWPLPPAKARDWTLREARPLSPEEQALADWFSKLDPLPPGPWRPRPGWTIHDVAAWREAVLRDLSAPRPFATREENIADLKALRRHLESRK